MDLIAALAENQIHLWLAFENELGEERLSCAYRDLLSPAEREQERRSYFSRDRRRYLATRALVRTVLSRYAPIDPRDWSFYSSPYGRPQIANVAARRLRLSFNVSHTDGLIVLAVSVDRLLGVDVENTKKREASIELATRFFAPAEVTALSAVERSQQQGRFFEYWTFKEAYIKARGRGLSLPLDKFSFRYPDDRSVRMSIHPDLADDSERWQLWQFRPTPDLLLSLCAERRNRGSSDVVFWKVVPMTSEGAIFLEPVRTSGPPKKGNNGAHLRKPASTIQ